MRNRFSLSLSLFLLIMLVPNGISADEWIVIESPEDQTTIPPGSFFASGTTSLAVGEDLGCVMYSYGVGAYSEKKFPDPNKPGDQFKVSSLGYWATPRDCIAVTGTSPPGYWSVTVGCTSCTSQSVMDGAFGHVDD